MAARPGNSERAWLRVDFPLEGALGSKEDQR